MLDPLEVHLLNFPNIIIKCSELQLTAFPGLPQGTNTIVDYCGDPLVHVAMMIGSETG